MRFCKDGTGRFAERPYYHASELDTECEQIITSFLTKKYGEASFPISTEALTRLIERDAADLDLGADLSVEGPGVDGVTDFTPGAKPKVRIERFLSEQKSEHRLRTTLTHEYGHVHFHKCLFDGKAAQSHNLFASHGAASMKCKRDTITGAPQSDWTEWQAGYACGALLMPVSHLTRVVGDYLQRHDLYGPLQIDTVTANTLTRLVSQTYHVSMDAAHFRLLKLGHLSTEAPSPRLF
jgi:hypothetical protein